MTNWSLAFGGQVLADALDGVALTIVEGEEFKSVAQALAVAHNGPHFDGIGRQRIGGEERLQSQRATPPWCEHVPLRCWLKL